jgi:hypothetical protein
MDELTEQGTILLGGPLGDDVDKGDALLVICAEDEAGVRGLLSADPWLGNVLKITSIQKWTLWLRDRRNCNHPSTIGRRHGRAAGTASFQLP